ncbi:MAG TPA: AAA family ATPase, partial [Pseudomonadota bacterium]|nr:AAA family ATPase [Pseudomonadota bacterium]
MLLDPATGLVCLLDFGIATRLSQELQQAIRPDDLEGTLAYVSPEQTGRMNRRLDRRSDLYSFGVTLYELLTGVLPFVSTDPLELIHSHIARTPTAPHLRAPEVPPVVSELCMRLLAKDAEDRYQSAQGVQADLAEALARLQRTGRVDPFPLAKHDFTYELQIPQRLYGRESAVAALLAAYTRASQGAVELLLVSGYSGIGKSSLISEIHRGIAQRGGYYIAGKFDPLSRGVPYEPVARAFSELIRQLLGEPQSVLQRWRDRLLAAVGSSGRLLIDLIPELELVIGPQPPVAALAASESQNRFALTFQNFLRVIATAEHPLILFLDDLQWADSASLRLLQILLGDPQSSHLLLIGAYRDNEIDSRHRLPLALAEIKRSGATVETLSLVPLGLPEVLALLADALNTDPARVEPLARLALGKTQGNPFFLSQFLLELYRSELLFFDREQKSWRWDLAGIEAAGITDNVAELMAGKLGRLSAGTKRALMLAACIGSTFEIKTLARIAAQPVGSVADDLWAALQEGLVLPLDAAYRFLNQRESGIQPALAEGTGSHLDVKYKFLHDRVRQAAYELATEAERQQIHLSIGRHLLGRGDGDGNSEQLFSLVMHLNLGSALIRDPAERLELVRYDLRAGMRAKAATAYHGAASYLSAGIALLGPAGWSTAYALCFDLHIELAECEYLNGSFERTEALFQTLLGQARSSLERARVSNL